MAQDNAYTGFRDAAVRASAAGVVVKLTADEARAVSWARDRGYVPQAGLMRWREDGSAALRVRRQDAYAWAESVDADEDAFLTCLGRDLCDKLLGAHVVITNRWAV